MSFGLFQLCSSISKRVLSGSKTSSLLGIFEGLEHSHPTHSVSVAILPFLGIQLRNFLILDSGQSLKKKLHGYVHFDDACQFLHCTGDGSPTAADESSTASQLCEAEKQQRAQKCNQRNATPVPGSRASLTVRIFS